MHSYHPLPSLLTSFVGRQPEKAQLANLLRQFPLVTVTGPGGSGKTRLALEVAQQFVQSGRAVVFSDLGHPTAEGLALHALGNALGIHEASAESMLDAVRRQLEAETVLILLDNAESVAAEVGAIAEAILRQCAGVSILVTSRMPLGASGERVWRLPAMSLPDGSAPAERWRTADAVELFAQRVEAACAGYVWDDRRRQAAARICERLDGIPLAVEIAAARVGSLAIEDLERQLEGDLSLLDSTGPAELRRHETLHATVDWSYRMLGEREQSLLRRLSAFNGGATLDAATHVCGCEEDCDADSLPGVADSLSRLVEHSMVIVRESPGQAARYALLEPLRDFALERLSATSERRAVARCHRDYFIQLAEDAAVRLRGSSQVAAMLELDAENGNVRTALSVSLAEDEPESAARLVVAMDLYWDIRARYRESLRWCELVLAGLSLESMWRGRVLRVAGRTRSALGEHDAAVALLGQSVSAARVAGDKRDLGESLCWLGMAFERQRDSVSALACAEEAESLLAADDAWLGALRLRVLAHGEKVRSGDMMCVESIHEREHALCQRAGDSLFTGNVLNCLGEFARWRGDYARAEAIYKESLARRRAVGDQGGTVLTTVNLGLLATQTGHLALALDYLSEALELSVHIGSPLQFAGVTLGLGAVASQLDEPAAGARILGITRALGRGDLDPPDAEVRTAAEARCRDALGDGRFAAFEGAGAFVSVAAAIEESREFVRTAREVLRNGSQRTRPSVAGLSPREAEVLALLASGLTNRDIAERLVLSTRTVETHVANAYAKLDVQNRAEATARAIQLGLTSAGALT